MNIYSLISLIATLAYVPLFLILIANRPWQRQKQTFAVFLMAIMLWGLGGFLFRSDYLVAEKIYIAKAILCICTLVITSLHYYLRTYYEKKAPGLPPGLSYYRAAICHNSFIHARGDSGWPNSCTDLWPGLYLLATYGAVILIGWDIYQLAKKIQDYLRSCYS